MIMINVMVCLISVNIMVIISNHVIMQQPYSEMHFLLFLVPGFLI